MGKVVNLNRFRKQKARADRDVRAEQNRRVHGRTKAERQAERLDQQRASRQLEGKRLSTEPAGPDEET